MTEPTFKDEWEARVVPTLTRNANVRFEMPAVDALFLRRVAKQTAESMADKNTRLLWKRVIANIEMGFAPASREET